MLLHKMKSVRVEGSCRQRVCWCHDASLSIVSTFCASCGCRWEQRDPQCDTSLDRDSRNADALANRPEEM